MQHTFVWGAILALLTVATLAAMARTQPAQNVIFVFIWMGLLSAVITWFWPALEMLPRWTAPVLWTNAVLNSRGVAKLLLRPWRMSEFYGIWLIALAGVLAMILLLPLKPSFFWFPIAIALQVVSVPWLIEKRPVIPPANYFPLWIWVALAGASMFYARWHATQ